MLAFEVRFPDGAKRRHDVAERDVTIGRDPDNSLPLDDPKVSNFHAVVFQREDGGYVLRDVGSSNGLTVNGEATFRRVLRPGDEVGIGPYTLGFLGEAAPAGGSDARHVPRLPRKPVARRAGAEDRPGSPTALDPTLALRQLPSTATAQGINWSAMTENRALQVLRCAQVIASTSNVQTMLGRLLESTLAWLRAEKGFVLLAEGDELVWRAGRPDRLPDGPLDAGVSAAVYGALESRSPMLSPSDASAKEGRDTLCIPLVAGGKPIGVVGAEGRLQGSSLTQGSALNRVEGLDIATALCALCAIHVANARERDRLQQQCAQLHEAASVARRLVGCSPAFRELLAQIHRAAQCDFPVLILGEMGSGKDVVAEAIHHLSARRNRRFLDVNCAALPEALLESEMFGHEAGAFTGAVARVGKFEAADGGTLFLNEIGDLSLNLQPKLFTVLDKKTITPVGSNDSVAVDVRILAATNQDLPAMVQSGKFRGELYRRIRCIEVTVPPLRARLSDILLLASYTLEHHAPGPLNETLRLSSEAAKLLVGYRWPMNVGELRNAILAAAIRANADTIEPEHLPEEIAGKRQVPIVKSLEQVKKEHICHVLRLTGGNKREAARLLGISPTTLHKEIQGQDAGQGDKTQDG